MKKLALNHKKKLQQVSEKLRKEIDHGQGFQKEVDSLKKKIEENERAHWMEINALWHSVERIGRTESAGDQEGFYRDRSPHRYNLLEYQQTISDLNAGCVYHTSCNTLAYET